MAMLITKFHRLIGSKLIWSIFSAIIIISFVFMFTEVPDMNTRRLSDVSPGKLDGKPVHPKEFQHAESQFRLSLAINAGRWLPVTEELRPLIREHAWKRLATLRLAEEMGFEVSDQELAGAIQQQEMFVKEGRFDRAFYEQFVSLYLGRQLGISRRDFENHLREQILIGRIEDMIQSIDLATPIELRQSFRMFTDSLDLQYVFLPLSTVEGQEIVDEAAARANYEADPEVFRIPELVKVDYATFRSADYLDQVEVDEAAALAFYDANIERFRKPVSQTDESTATAKEGDELAAPSEALPFDEVKEVIIQELKLAKARELAGQAATEFVVDVQRANERTRANVRQVAAEKGIQVEESPALRITDTVAGIDVPGFAETAFSLRDNADEHFSDPLSGDDAFYVLGLAERIDSRIPAFEEVREDAITAAQRQLDSDRLRERAGEIRTRLQAGLAKGSRFDVLAEVEGFEVKSADNLSAMGQLDDVPHATALLRASATLVKGELADPVAVPGGVILAYVENRSSADAAMFSMIAPRIRQNLLQSRHNDLVDGFQRYVLERGSFEDLQTARDKEEPAS